MEQGWGKTPQAGPVFPDHERERMPALHILFNTSILEKAFFPLQTKTWHTNCFASQAEVLLVAGGEKRILIIDPSPKERRGLSQSLKNEDYHIETGRNLSEAIKKISAGGFNCLVMDINLPEMRGYEAVSILKNLDPKLKIIMTTKKNTKKLEAKVREQDIFFYFIKSFGKDELKLAIKNAFHT